MPLAPRHLTPLALIATGFLTSGVSLALPTVKIVPPVGSRFAVDQRFDVRVEITPDAAGGAVTSATVTLDGTPLQGTLDASNGKTIRNVTFSAAGSHTLTATAVDGSGTGTATRTLDVIDPAGASPKVRNVIVFLGDGMGVAHRTAARIVRYGVDNGHVKGHLAMDDFPGVAMVNTHSLNSIITDSAPGMACYVTGNKSNNNQEGVWPDNTVAASTAPDQSLAFDNPRVEYLSEYLHRKMNKVTGIVSTADIEDATPAANAVHTSNRNAGTGVCDQYFDERDRTGLRVLLGGGRRWFLPAGQPGSSRSATTDYKLDDATAAALGAPTGAIDPARDLISDFEKDGFAYVSDRATLSNVGAGTTKLLGLFGYGNMNVAWDKLAKRRNPAANGVVDDYLAPDQPMLDEMTTTALNVLNNNADGFYLMVEGAHIDKQSHYMDADRAIVETIEFDNAIKRAREFADKTGDFANRAGTAGDTLILVTADHECSGFSLIGALSVATATAQSLTSDKMQAAVGTYDAAHFPTYPVDANGYPTTMDPDGKLLVGFGANADRTENWISDPLPMIDSLLPDDIKASLKAKSYIDVAGNPGPPTDTAYGATRRDAANGFFITGQVPGDQAVHTASDIELTAYGTGWQQFTGEIDNTDVFFKALTAASGGFTGAATGGTAYDVNGDGKINIADAILVLKKAVGL